jgi:hypothetical protein
MKGIHFLKKNKKKEKEKIAMFLEIQKTFASIEVFGTLQIVSLEIRVILSTNK